MHNPKMCIIVYLYILNTYMYLSIWQSIYIFIYLTIFLSIYLFIYRKEEAWMSSSLRCAGSRTIYLSIYLSIYIYISIYLSIYLGKRRTWMSSSLRCAGSRTIYLYIYLSIYLSFYLYLSILSIYLQERGGREWVRLCGLLEAEQQRHRCGQQPGHHQGNIKIDR